MTKTYMLICMLLVSALILCPSQSSAQGKPIVRIYVFQSPECTHCEPVHKENIEKIADKLRCKVDIKYFNIENIEEYQRLCDLEKKYGKSSDEMPVVFIGKGVLGGEKEAAEKMESTISKYAKEGAAWPDEITFDKSAEEKSTPLPSHILTSAIEFEKIEINLGELKAGEVVKAIFKFKNTGAQGLEIKRVRSSCGCFEHKAASTKLRPGESSMIEVDFKTEGLGGDFNKSVMVDSNDPAHPTVRLIIKAKIDPIAVLSPERFNFGSMAVNSTIEKTILLTPVKPDGFKIVSAKSDGMHVSAAKIEKANGKYRIKVRIKAGGKSGRVYEKLVFRAYSADGPTIPFMVFGNVEEKVAGDAKSH